MFDELRSLTPPVVLDIADRVRDNARDFIVWPGRALLLWPGIVRMSSGFHTYPEHVVEFARRAGVALDRRTNGPAIVSFLLAGGVRPPRTGTGHQWSVHHIYDGLHPAPGRRESVRAVACGNYFTEAAGLVAVHPVADALASEVPSFAWFLREEAYRRFGFDPDGVFGSGLPEADVMQAVAPDNAVPSDHTTIREPRAIITAKRLTFKANVIEALADDDLFEIRTPDATWRMTKAEFYEMFPKVVVSESYAGPGRLYSYTLPPARIEKYRVR